MATVPVLVVAESLPSRRPPFVGNRIVEGQNSLLAIGVELDLGKAEIAAIDNRDSDAVAGYALVMEIGGSDQFGVFGVRVLEEIHEPVEKALLAALVPGRAR